MIIIKLTCPFVVSRVACVYLVRVKSCSFSHSSRVEYITAVTLILLVLLINSFHFKCSKNLLGKYQGWWRGVTYGVDVINLRKTDKQCRENFQSLKLWY